MSVINTNITSLIAQQNLNSSKGDLTTAMERLSSGLRINSAADDAAGQAIANRMSAQITGLSQAQRNANDGISVAQTTEGALNQINDNLQRVRELTVQSANDTNSQEDLNSIQDEIDARLSEINRISEETSFNGVKVLAEDQSLSIQVGANDGETINIELSEITADTLELGDFNVNTSLVEAPGTGAEVTAAQDETFTVDGVTYTASGTGTTGAGSTTIATGAIAADLTGTDIAGATNSLVSDEDGNVYIKSISGGETSYYEAELAATDGDATNPPELSFTIADGAQPVSGLTENADEAATANPLAALDSALSQVDGLRSDLGAIQNRFDSAITNLATTETNLTSARSRIEDADYATEVSNMTRNQILQQAGTSILAQANQLPQSVLSLLG